MDLVGYKAAGEYVLASIRPRSEQEGADFLVNVYKGVKSRAEMNKGTLYFSQAVPIVYGLNSFGMLDSRDQANLETVTNQILLGLQLIDDAGLPDPNHKP